MARERMHQAATEQFVVRLPDQHLPIVSDETLPIGGAMSGDTDVLQVGGALQKLHEVPTETLPRSNLAERSVFRAEDSLDAPPRANLLLGNGPGHVVIGDENEARTPLGDVVLARSPVWIGTPRQRASLSGPPWRGLIRNLREGKREVGLPGGSLLFEKMLSVFLACFFEDGEQAIFVNDRAIV